MAVKWKHINIFTLGVIVSLAGIVRFYGLNQPIWPDEALYANAAKNLYATGKFTFDGTPWSFLQPPLFIGLISLSYLLFGISEFSARVISPTFGVLGVVAVYYLGRELYNERVGLVAGFILAITPTHWFYSRMITPDIVLVTLITLAIVFFYKGYEFSDKKYLLLTGILIGLACMTKRSGLAIYLIIITYLTVRERNLAWLKNRSICMMFFISLLLQSPWYIRNYIVFNDPLISTGSYVPGHWITTGAIGLPHAIINYFNLLYFSISLPLSLAFLFGTYVMLRERKKEALLALLPIAVTLVLVFSFWGTSESVRYLLPILPFSAVIGAYGIETVLKLNKRMYLLVFLLFLISFSWISFQHGLGMIFFNKFKYEGYHVAGDWIDQNTTSDAYVVTNSRAIWFYSNRRCMYFPEDEKKLLEIVNSADGNVYLVIGEWPTVIGYPEYVESLPERWKDRTNLAFTFYRGDEKTIRIYRAKKDYGQ